MNHPVVTIALCLVILLPLAAVTSTLSTSYDDLRTLPSSNPVVQSAVTIQAHFGSMGEPETLVISNPKGDLALAQGTRAIAALTATLKADPAVSQVLAPTLSSDGHVAAVPFTLGVETSSPQSHVVVGRIQAALAATARGLGLPGLEPLLAGDSANTHDVEVQVTAVLG